MNTLVNDQSELRLRIYGIYLPEDILQEIDYQNAQRIFSS